MYSSKCRGGAGSAGVRDERTTKDAGGAQVRVIDFDDRQAGDRRSSDRQANGRQPDHRQTNDRQSDDRPANDWLAINQFTVVENRRERRPDVVLFVNGLPLAVIELKNPGRRERHPLVGAPAVADLQGGESPHCSPSTPRSSYRTGSKPGSAR